MNEFIYYLLMYASYIFYGLLAIFLFRILFKSNILTYHSNWNYLIDGFTFSTEEFYQRLKTELQSHGIKNVNIYPVHRKEGSFFSSSRRYLRVEWKEYRYDVCSAPFGKGFFISWWLLYKNSILKIILSRIPFVGRWVAEKWFPITYYKVDTASMYMTYCQNSVLKVIDDITKEGGVRALTEDERKPVLKDVFKR
jgi:hypothetical protein